MADKVKMVLVTFEDWCTLFVVQPDGDTTLIDENHSLPPRVYAETAIAYHVDEFEEIEFEGDESMWDDWIISLQNGWKHPTEVGAIG